MGDLLLLYPHCGIFISMPGLSPAIQMRRTKSSTTFWCRGFYPSYRPKSRRLRSSMTDSSNAAQSALTNHLQGHLTYLYIYISISIYDWSMYIYTWLYAYTHTHIYTVADRIIEKKGSKNTGADGKKREIFCINFFSIIRCFSITYFSLLPLVPINVWPISWFCHWISAVVQSIESSATFYPGCHRLLNLFLVFSSGFL